jgi:serine/threonine protein kinase
MSAREENLSNAPDPLLAPGDEPAEDDPRLVQALREYQAAIEDGSRPNRHEFLARYPTIASDLSDCLDGLDFLSGAVQGLQVRDKRAPAPLPGQADGTLGDFRLVREIGRGGMGVVYEAEQISLRRRVALKVLPFAATLDARQLQRFENEARAAAGLHHGNIVPVFAVGCERGVHYYAMQLIDGLTLAALIVRLRQAHEEKARDTLQVGRSATADTAMAAASLTPGSIGTRAFFRTVAALGVQAAEALEYAHQMGVVHRDVKPANLLLDGRGNLWVTDFGLARFSANPGMTGPGDLVGTLRYMSPEQAAGKPVIDPRSDVYSLGATLYEVLTQRPAFPGRDKNECLRQILEEEPPALRGLNPSLPVELETIVLKAMAKHPEDRYTSAKDLADDLKRFLDDKPVQARRPGLRERAAKWARRHRRVVAAAVLGLVAAVLVLSATTWRIARAEATALAANEELKAEEERTQAALAQEAEQRGKAERNYREARKVLDYLTRLGVEELADKPDLQPLRRRLLTELLAYYREFIDQHSDDPSIAAELIETRLQVAEILDEIGKKAESLAAYEQAMRERGNLPEPRPLGPFGKPPRMPRGLAWLFLLGQPAVQKDLKLSAEQLKQVRQLVGRGEWSSSVREHTPPRSTPGKPTTGESLAAAEKALAGVLKPDQSDRLRQIGRQLRGPRGLLDAETAERLGLTEEQKEELRSLLGRSMRGPPRRRGRRPEERKQINEQALQVLSAEQRSTWKGMLGEPLRGEVRFGPPRGRPMLREGR